MKISNYRKLRRWLTRMNPNEFDYANGYDLTCGCVSVQVRRLELARGIMLSEGVVYDGVSSLRQALGISFRQAQNLYVGTVSGRGQNFSNPRRNWCTGEGGIKRAIQCLDAIARRHGVRVGNR